MKHFQTSALEQFSQCHSENTKPLTNPISDILPQLNCNKTEGETCPPTVSSKLVISSSIEGDLKDSSSLKGGKPKEDTISVGSNHTNGESGDQQGSYLSGWQVDMLFFFFFSFNKDSSNREGQVNFYNFTRLVSLCYISFLYRLLPLD